MRSKMLGLAIALSTFGLGVAATTLWIAYRTPEVQRLESRRIERGIDLGMLSFPNDASSSLRTPAPTNQFTPCDSEHARAGQQTGTHAPEIIINGGVLNDRAVIKPAPAYPALARAAHASGIVVVKVLVDDESGRVVWAKTISGNALLQQAAAQAAYGWSFVPTASCSPSKTSGVITFNFLLQ